MTQIPSTAELVQRLVKINIGLMEFEKSLEDIGLTIGAKASGFENSMIAISDTILDLLGIPEDTTTRPDCREIFERYGNQWSACYAHLPSDFYCRDGFHELLFEVVRGNRPVQELLVEAEKEATNDGCSDE